MPALMLPCFAAAIYAFLTLFDAAVTRFAIYAAPRWRQEALPICLLFTMPLFSCRAICYTIDATFAAARCQRRRRWRHYYYADGMPRGLPHYAAADYAGFTLDDAAAALAARCFQLLSRAARSALAAVVATRCHAMFCAEASAMRLLLFIYYYARCADAARRCCRHYFMSVTPCRRRRYCHGATLPLRHAAARCCHTLLPPCYCLFTRHLPCRCRQRVPRYAISRPDGAARRAARERVMLRAAAADSRVADTLP